MDEYFGLNYVYKLETVFFIQNTQSGFFVLLSVTDTKCYKYFFCSQNAITIKVVRFKKKEPTL
jgi:hypothetical protein